MQIVGDNWDGPIFATLEQSPPLRDRDDAARHEHVTRVIISQAGTSLKRFLSVAVPRLTEVIGSTADDPVHLFMHWLATYYTTMFDVFHDSPEVIKNWDQVIQRFTESQPAQSERLVFLTFQHGFPLLCPSLVSAGRRKPLRLLMHKQNTFAVNFFRANLGESSPIFLEDSGTTYSILRALRAERDLIANIDFAYPDTRTLDIRLFERRLTIPAGIFQLARRTESKVICISLNYDLSGVSFQLSDAIDLGREDLESALEQISSFFEEVIRNYPFQWLGWPSLK